MADHTKTISNSMNLFGGSPSSLWNAWNWNAFKWGEGTSDLIVSVGKLIGESLSLSDAIVGHDAVKLISEALASTTDMTDVYLTDGSGYYYVFVSDTTDADDRDEVTYTAASDGSTSWTAATEQSSNWS